MNNETLSLEEGAQLARVGLECFTELATTGQIPATRLNQKHWVLLREDVIDFIRTRGREQAKARRQAFAAKKPDDGKPARGGGRRRRALPALAADAP